MAGRPVLLILGAGPRVGTSVADSFAASGYNVAVVSRKGTKSEATKGYLSLQADFSKPESVPALFDAVTKQYKEAPSVVVYNAAAMTPPPADGTLAIPAEKVASDLNVNTVSPYVAAQEAVKGWQTLLKEAKKTFIYTGNALNNLVLPVPMMVNLGVGKAASACWIGVADETYSTQGYRQLVASFFYADERYADGKMKGMELDGPAHGEFYTQLAEHPADVPWQATFVKGSGYVKL